MRKTLTYLLSVGFLAALAGCGTTEAEPSATTDEVQAFLDENPEAANAELDPPPDPEI
ncbi:MAG: hypothetical protein AAFX06_24650 [Planctomycetota bacterium]